MTLRQVISSAAGIALGIVLVRFGRSTYRSPGRVRERWYSGFLPDAGWSRTLLRFMAVVWIFSGLIFVTGSVLLLTPLAPAAPGSVLGWALVVIPAVATPFLLPRTVESMLAGKEGRRGKPGR